jgi:hypothetical protein
LERVLSLARRRWCCGQFQSALTTICSYATLLARCAADGGAGVEAETEIEELGNVGGGVGGCGRDLVRGCRHRTIAKVQQRLGLQSMNGRCRPGMRENGAGIERERERER